MEWLNALELLEMVGRGFRSLIGLGPPDQKPIGRAADISLAVFTLVVLGGIVVAVVAALVGN